MSAKTEAVAVELRALKDEEGRIIPRVAVAWARRHRSSALHAELEWDDSVAGNAYREQQVRQLIQVYVSETYPGVRRFISLSVDRVEGGGYRELTDIEKAPNLRECMLQDALNELQRVKRKYVALEELKRVWDAADAVRPPRGRPPGKKAA